MLLAVIANDEWEAVNVVELLVGLKLPFSWIGGSAWLFS